MRLVKTYTTTDYWRTPLSLETVVYSTQTHDARNGTTEFTHLLIALCEWV